MYTTRVTINTVEQDKVSLKEIAPGGFFLHDNDLYRKTNARSSTYVGPSGLGFALTVSFYEGTEVSPVPSVTIQVNS